VFAQELKMPAIFSDNLVLQAGKDTPVFGWAAPGASVEVKFTARGKSVSAKATADKDGKWLARMPELPAGLEGTLTVKSGKDTLTFSDALIGEVWLCGGQSNMAWTIGAGTMSEEIKQTARDEADKVDGKVRMFRVRRVGADEPQDDVQMEAGKWEVVTPENVKNCTAVGWNFAVRVNKEAGLPVGLINSNWGGTVVEAWLPKEVIDSTSVADSVWQRHEQMLEGWEEKMDVYNEQIKEFNETYKTNSERLANRRLQPRKPYSPTDRNAPCRLYNAMMHGLGNYGMRGMLWYQGEANAGWPRVNEYGELMKALVNSYRARINPQLYFYYVELANFTKPQADPVQLRSWAYVREQQAAVLELPGTGVATAIDVGEADDIHPTDKKTVGNRLAGMALNDIYGKKSLCRSPQYASHKISGDKVIITFDNADGLRERAGKEKSFAIRGADGNWVWADKVKISGNAIEVSAQAIKDPAAVRYAWASNPETALENKEGLPLLPFRTDKDSVE